MDKVSLMRMLAIPAAVALTGMWSIDTPPTDPPSPGGGCRVLNATAHDNHGHAMICVNMTDGPDNSVWQYAGTY